MDINTQESIQPGGQISNARTFSHEAMASVFQFSLVHEDADYARHAALAAFAEIDRLERELSRFIENSDIARLNNAPVGWPVTLGLDSYACLQLARQAWEDTGGAFDVTVGSLYRCWHGDDRIPRTPTQAQIASAMERTGMQRLHLDSKLYEIATDTPGVQVDLGAIGKGYALDCAAAILREWNVPVGLLNAGSSTILLMDPPPGKKGWPLAFHHPLQPDQVLLRLDLANRSVSGSGQKSFRHILDPRPGRVGPVTGKIATWSLAASGARSDALSTAFLVLDPADVEAFCRKHPQEAAVVVLGDFEKRMVSKIASWGPWPKVE
jgi:thiamine biosynthesis lipoprotein